jgi:alanine dehydrogenase
MDKIIYIRKELNNNEKRTPIIPLDIKFLINSNYIIYIESSQNRIFKDDDYEKEGAFITKLKWNHPKFKDALIIGLKELDDLNNLNNHQHVYFAHCYKKQNNSIQILNAFKKSNSILYDFEYFLNQENNKRIISFGFYAGIAGVSIGLLQYYSYLMNNKDIKDLKYYENQEILISDLKNINLTNKTNKTNKNPQIVIIGPNGNCGKGVQYILNKFNIKYDILTTSDIINISSLKKYDIIFNCILLNEKYNNIWFSEENITKITNPLLIIDISCDNEKKNNPIQLKYPNTTFQNPIYQINEFIKIIAISNLPSFLPKDSSTYFSSKCTQLLLEYSNDIYPVNWINNKDIFIKL